MSTRAVSPLAILADQLEQVCRELADLGVAPDLLGRARAAHALAAGMDPYLAQCTTAESPQLSSLAERTRAADWATTATSGGGSLEPEMLSGHVEGSLLKFLVHATQATRVLEIGMFTGYSALAMAEALPVDGQVVACEIDAGVAAFATDCFAQSTHGPKIAVRVGPALATLHELGAEGATFDLVFIDADKAAYTAYLDAVLDSGLLRPHGIVCVDNTLMQGLPYGAGDSTPDGRAIAAFNQALAADPRVEQVLLPLRDGLTLIRRLDPLA